MIKVAMVSSILPETNYSRFLIESIQSNLKDNVEMLVYTDKSRKNLEVPLDKVKLVWSASFLYPFQIFRQVIRDRVDIVHLQHEINMYGGPTTAVLFPLLMLLLRFTKAKRVVTIHAVVPKRQITCDFMEAFSRPCSKPFAILARYILSFICRMIPRLSSLVIVHSNYIRSVLISDYKAFPDKIMVIPHGVPDKEISKANHSSGGKLAKRIVDKKVILSFGYVVKRKDLEILIEAFSHVAKRHTDYLLVIAGGELPYQKGYISELKSLAKSKGLESNIVFTSFIDAKELERLFRLARFVVLPCKYSISASGPLAITIHYHKPVITTDVGTFHEDVRHGQDGILYPAGDISALERAMNRLIEDPALCQRLSRGMELKARERSWSNIASKTYQVYQRLVV